MYSARKEDNCRANMLHDPLIVELECSSGESGLEAAVSVECNPEEVEVIVRTVATEAEGNGEHLRPS